MKKEALISELLEQIRHSAEALIEALGYPGIALLMFIENLFPPIPSEVVMPFAGFLVNEGEMSFAGVMAAGTIGSLLGAVAIYGVGIWLGEARLRAWIQRYGKRVLLSEEDLAKSLRLFEENGKKMVLLGRVIPTIRSLISLPAGLRGMNMGVFLLFTLVGTTLWNLALAGGGVYLGQQWQRILSWVDTYSMVIYALLGVAVVAFGVRQWQKRTTD